MFSDYIVFVDESGDHQLGAMDPAYPVFVLSFCVFAKACYADVLTPAVRRLKFETFGHDMVVLHEADIVRKKGAFAALGLAQRSALMNRLGALISRCDFTLISIVIDKARYKVRYDHPEHPYHLGLQLGLERLHAFLDSHAIAAHAVTHVVCEARGKKEDNELAMAFRRVCDGENRERTKYPFALIVADKKTNCEGLQLADLTARPIGLHVCKPEQPNRAVDILRPKWFRGRPGSTVIGYGLTVFPPP